VKIPFLLRRSFISFALLGGGTNVDAVVVTVAFFASSNDIFVAQDEIRIGMKTSTMRPKIGRIFMCASFLATSLECAFL
jgi:hypothetical protein